MGCSTATISGKLNCNVDFSQEEIAKAVEVLHLRMEDIPTYFFTARVQFSKLTLMKKVKTLNELATYNKQLPDNIEDIARFAIFNSEKLKSLKAEINAIDKLHLAKEVYDQKIKEQIGRAHV